MMPIMRTTINISDALLEELRERFLVYCRFPGIRWINPLK